MLPFLKRQEAGSTGLIVKTRDPDKKPEENQDDSNPAAEACASELIRAIHSRDSKAVVAALKDVLDTMEDAPEDNSFEAQNIKAAEEQE